MQQPTTSNRLRPFRPTPFGRYTLLMPLSMGGMGEIFLARIDGPQGFEKLCVIKKILPHLAEDKDFVTRFGNEARTLVKLTHGSIAQVLDMGQHQGEPYLALEYIDGKDLRKVGARFRERGMPLPLTFVLFVFARVLDALAYAHRKRDDDDKEIGLVHRDMSPQNILISYEGEVKVIDFGLAKSTLSNSKTNPSIILGKFLYMSPEQARHAKVDRRSDLYAVGICLYELIAGKNPFEDIPPHALMAAVATPNIPHVQQVEPLCPTNIASIIMKALAVDPAQRFQTAEELRGKLLGALLEIDPSAGPESCSRFMRDMFAAEYHSERKLLTQLKEAARSEILRAEPPADDDPVTVTRNAQVRPIGSARQSTPRLEPPPADEATPAPTDLRKYGMEPTVPRAKALEPAPLSFAPTPKIGGHASDRSNEGDRETMPGVVIGRGPEGQVRIIGRDSDPDTGPHEALYPEPPTATNNAPAQPSPEMMADAPTRPVPVGRASSPGMTLPRPVTPMAAPSGKATEITAPSMEPVTTEATVVGTPSDLDLPSVVVSGLPPPAQPAKSTGSTKMPPVKTSSVLVPAASVRTPEVVAPLPKALEGKHRPDENLVTDRGTRTRRTSVALVLLPLFAFLGLAGFVFWDTLMEKMKTEEDEQYADSLLKSNSDDRKRRAMKLDDAPPPPPDEPLVEPLPTKLEPPPPPKDEAPAPAPEASANDELAKLPTSGAAPAPPPVAKKPPPKTKAGNELRLVRNLLARKQNQLEQSAANAFEMRLQGLEQRSFSAAPNSLDERKLLRDIADLKAKIETAK